MTWRILLLIFTVFATIVPAEPKTIGLVGNTDDANPREALIGLLEGGGHTVIDRRINLNLTA